MTTAMNIVQVTTHDSGRHFGCYGHSTVRTPHVDAVAGQGVRLANMFTTSPICSPARCSLATGLYPQQHGMMDLPPRGWRLTDPTRHLAYRLRAAGYHTALAGQQHEAPAAEIPGLGFDRLVAQAEAGAGRPNAIEVARAAAAVIADQAEAARPLYLQVGFVETHTPWDFGGATPDDSLGVDVPGYLVDEPWNRQLLAAFQGALRQADAAVGIIAAALNEAGISDDTLLVVTTDHGVEMPRAKWDLADPGIEVAMIARCPAAGITGGRVVEALASVVDYVPTIADLAGFDASDAEGTSLLRQLAGDTDQEVRDEVFGLFHQRSTRCVRTRTHKFTRWLGDVGYYRHPVSWDKVLQRSVSTPVFLHDLAADRWEFDDRSDDPALADVRADLDTRLWRWMEHVDDPLLRGPIASRTYLDAMADYSEWKQAGQERPG